MLHPQGFTRLPFSTPCGFNTLRLAHVLDSLVRVSRRVVRNRFVYNQGIGQQPYLPIYQEESPSKLSSPYLAVEESPVAAYPCYKPSPICTRTTGQRHAVVRASLCRPPGPGLHPLQGLSAFRTLTTHRFQGLLTLYSKFFASFHHCACSLSVSGQYLALAEGHLPICSALPN